MQKDNLKTGNPTDANNVLADGLNEQDSVGV